LPVAAIDAGLVLGVLEQPVNTADGTASLWNARTETATRLRCRIESVLDWAKVHGFREGDNPANWKTIKHALPLRGKVQKVKHHAALPYAEIGAFMADLGKREGITARALEFAILTAARSGEVRGATWEEIDMDAKVWTIPAERMKAGREHRVPLSDTAMKLLEALPRYAGNGFVFPSSKTGGMTSDTALMAVLRRMGRSDLTVHGFRSTFGDWAGEKTDYQYEVRQQAIAHKLPDKADGAYFRSDLFVKRKGLMEDWARYCRTIETAKEGNVVPIRKKAV
jgi:integrase